MSRVGLHRRGSTVDVDDPLDGLVNLFDVGIVLAVAFLVAGLSLGAKAATDQAERPAQDERTVTVPEDATPVEGRGTAVGTVYRLPDGRLVLGEDSAGSP
ncbi:MAG: DUF2149 domain-containing protein [Patulibacter sp.]|nr:DUF2149 domain-containing protein [Patulibacter sp.]